VEITDTTCHTWTHHVGKAVRVECVAHGVVFDGPRDQATEAKREHDQAVEQ